MMAAWIQVNIVDYYVTYSFLTFSASCIFKRFVYHYMC